MWIWSLYLTQTHLNRRFNFIKNHEEIIINIFDSSNPFCGLPEV